jgi:CRP-like cAMP-binding protein
MAKSHMKSTTASKAGRFGDLSGSPLLAGVPPAELQRDCPSARILSLGHRDTIYRQGGTNKAIFCLLKGQVTLARVNPDGATLTTAALSAGDFFGDGLDGSADAARRT